VDVLKRSVPHLGHTAFGSPKVLPQDLHMGLIFSTGVA